jgi:putative oxygen-independent coproporphyrinogen III oxidase
MVLARAQSGRVFETAAQRLMRYMRTGTLSLPALPPLSLYIHLPWCLKKCPYCDFNSHEWGRRSDHVGGGLPQDDYIQALQADLEANLPLIWGRQVHSIFMGGGTPSLFEPDRIDRLLGHVRSVLPLEPDCEITLEANPGTFERERFKAFRQAGVNRLSVGVQSFSDHHLAALGRVHDADQALAAVQEAAEFFETFNIDLMYALPGQALKDLDQDLAQALALRPPHLSIYHLTLEPNTAFANNPPQLPDDDLASDMLDLIVQRTSRSLLARYEVSAFARGNHRCVHNLNYWKFGDYLGIGAGAHSKLSYPSRIIRQVRYRDPQAYMMQARLGDAVSQDIEVARADLPFEFMMNALRLQDGFARPMFSERTGLPWSAAEAAIDAAVQRDWLAFDGDQIYPTGRGFNFLNDVLSLFLPEADVAYSPGND